MSNGIATTKFRRVSLASIVLAAVLLVAPMLGAQAQWGYYYPAQATIKSINGATLGTATFTPTSTGSVSIHVTLTGLDPVAGSHRIALTNVGNCCPPSSWCSGSEVLVLPDLQLMPNGTADYTAETGSINMDWFRQQPQGSAIVLHADTNAVSSIIGCGVISIPGGPGWWQPTPVPGYCPPQQPYWPGWHQPHPQPKPQPAAVIGNFRVTATAGLRLRSGPGTGYRILRIVSYGTILGNTGVEQWNGGMEWVKVVYGGSYYWAARQYLAAY